ncbi:MAG: hypothetical protein AABZ31_13380 [Bdellovibrionota bacterium]
MTTNILVFLALLKVSEYYDEIVCASLWAALQFTTFMFTKTLWFATWRSVLSFCVAYVVFKYIRRTRNDLGQWVIATAVGIVVLTFLG